MLRFSRENLADSDEMRCNACRLQKQCVSADGKRCNASRLKNQIMLRFPGEIREIQEKKNQAKSKKSGNFLERCKNK